MNSNVNVNQDASYCGASRLEVSIQQLVIVSALKSDANLPSHQTHPAASAGVPRTLSAVTQRFSTIRPASVYVQTSANHLLSKTPTHAVAFVERGVPDVRILIGTSVSVWETANGSAEHLTATVLTAAQITEPGAVGKCG